MEVNQKELAKILGISDRRIRQLKELHGLFEDGIIKGKSKRYELEKCVPEYINYKIESETGNEKTVIKEKEQAEHEMIKKQISILKLRKLKRELHAADDVEEFITNMLVEFKGKLLASSQKLAPLLVGEDDINVILNILEKEMFETLDALSEYDPIAIDKESHYTSEIYEDEEEDSEEE